MFPWIIILAATFPPGPLPDAATCQEMGRTVQAGLELIVGTSSNLRVKCEPMPVAQQYAPIPQSALPPPPNVHPVIPLRPIPPAPPPPTTFPPALVPSMRQDERRYPPRQPERLQPRVYKDLPESGPF